MRKGTRTFGRLAAALTLALLCGAALGAAEERLEKAKALYEQAKPLAAQADDPDAEAGDRNSARSEALKLLKQARDEFQAWQSANGENADDAIGPEIGKLLYWMKKMSGIAPPPPPREDRPPPKPPVNPPSSGEPGGATPEPVKPAEPDPGQQARDDFARLLEREKEFKDDPGAIKDLYEQFLVDHPDPSLPEYVKAATRLGQVQEELNASFKAIVKTDPERLDNVDSKATDQAILRLKRDLQTKDPDLRRNAAKLLGLTRSGAASYSLVQVLRDSDEELVKIAGESLVAIGGWRTGENLTKQYRDASHDSQAVALDVLKRIAAKGSVDAQSVSYWIGRFVLSNDGEIAGDALFFLEKLGPDGGPGLVEAMETRRIDKKLAVMDSIGKAKYYRGATRVSAHLLRGDGAAVEVPRAKAMSVIQGMGIHTIPYLMPALQNGRTKSWTYLLLTQMTGARIGPADIGAWKDWYRMHKGDAQYAK